jgi:hypothetical protein
MQVLDINAAATVITAITSFRDPDLAIRCGFPATISD